ncbi:hypothetical protein Lesp02_12950 [Lentzea sp. NBRC 105346]|uniref:non-ribosomal peptide synthetase n=1 Tax=Lentzea sp. NBRC 105346 TaxID=3032205 RepID=UPI0024A5B0B3|nr:non-ribosomal peptide synthetase [Lentzea sp. NBRC 105346]GLZ29105.1 hypothetical protein Lesp02_12950 [Lentzea sp. NBRC 105346]
MQLLPELFARQAALTPDALAVADDHQELTYAQLDRASGALAAALLDGGHPGAVVGVRMTRGVNLAVALWGIWKAGAAYVALDHNHPADRIAAIMAETGCGLVVDDDTVRAAVDRFEPVAGVEVQADDLAYILYTSGSTGRPKGAVLSHGNAANRIVTLVAARRLRPADRWLQKSALSFDASVTELFSPLICGASVVFAPDGAERDARMMLEAVVRHRATVLQVVPSVLRLLLAEPMLADCTSLRIMSSGGELLHYELLHQLWAKLPEIEYWNTYGPTECTVEQTELLVGRDQAEGPVPIGAPIEGCHILVLDETGELVPPGLPGEIWVGGSQVGLGYIGRPDLTAERYVPDPFGPPGSRMYNTGDRARWRDDGLLEWLGRTDGQIKVAGVRMEPAEIESALRAHPNVQACAALAVPNGTDKRLVAYVQGEDLNPTELRAFLRGRLPDYMIPTLFVPIDKIPLTTNGKPDRNALLLLDIEELTPVREHVPLSTPAEHTVAEAWANLLEQDEIGAEDDFFQLGGHSLLITRLAERLRERFGRRVEIRDLFAATTVRAQAELMSTVDVNDAPIPEAVPVDGMLPLSSGQKRLWFLEKLRGGGQEYLVPVFLPVPDGIQPQTVKCVLSELAERHEVLRTRFGVRDGEPFAIIDEPRPVELRVVETADNALFAEELARGFDLENGPVWRALFVRDTNRLLVTLHHIACDGQSIAVLTDEFHRLVAGEELPELPVRYVDHAAWQHANLARHTEQLDHWRDELKDLAPIDLPTDRPRAAERDSAGAGLTFTLPPDQAEKLLAQGRKQGATPFMTLLTVFSTLLGRYTNTWDFAVGTPTSGRTRQEVEHVVGFFLNTLVLRNRVRPDRTFAEALADTRSLCQKAFRNSDVPFERLVEEVQADRDLSRTPLFQVIFDLHEGDVATSNNTEADLEAMKAIWKTAKTDLTLIMRRHDDGSLQGILEFATALFDEATIERMAANFVRLAGELAQAPDVPVAMVPMLGEAEHDLIIHRFNATAAPQPILPVHLTIAERACEHPDVTALVSDGRVTTCAELDARANQVAHALQSRGVGVESVVGVLLDRTPDLVATLLGVWKAGAAYVPLDPSFPADRLTSVLEDSGALLLVTDTELGSPYPVEKLLVDTIDHAPADPVLVDDGDLDRLAYIIYTSGSTGRPKGVAVSHRGLANYLSWSVGAYAAHGTGGAPVFTSIAYDLGIPNLFTPLLTGQPAHLFGVDLDLTKLGPTLADAGPFAFMKMAPAQLELVLHQLANRPPAKLAGLVSAAGDWVPAAMAEQWRAVNGTADTKFVGEYGPTEITIGNSLFDSDRPWAKEFLSIGRPIPNTTMYVLDEFLRPVPIGATGEIYIGGAGVARGYVGRPDLTAEKFLPDPYGAPGSRLYRTGDLGRMTATGDVEFRGRADNQVKIRGYRVELGEIEAGLLAHPTVREAVVVVDEQRLVAYCAGEDQDVRAFLTERMPAHQVPEVIVWLDTLPLNANGKVDRKALPKPQAQEAIPEDRPRNPIEERVTAIWTRVLPGAVGVHDNFFAVGGHSLAAVKLVSLIREELGIEIGVRTLFDKPTVAGLAGVLEDHIRTELERRRA